MGFAHSNVWHSALPSVVTTLLTQPLLPSKQTSSTSLSPPLISMLIFLASILLLVSSYVIYTRFYTRMINTIRSRSRRNIINPNNHTRDHHDFLDEEHGSMADNPFWYITTVGLQSSIINSITVCKYKKGEGLVEGTDCAVCLTEFEEDDSLRLLPKCNHAFHIPCIDTWLSSHTNCPLCRAPIIPSVVNFPPPLPSSSAANSSLTENTHVENPENNYSFRRDLRISAEEEGELNRTSSRRKTISMDFASGSSINFQAWSNRQLVKLGKAVAASSRGVEEEDSSSSSSIQPKGSASMKRSMSCSGMLLSSRNSTGRNTQI
ncbi:hypothetical protein Nepgr_004863 [Nepenthes gracilis]|uniref:RING-type E3 ubiquitin transferase n=1 Tax=Nepenthes gracilis TaxID=150966 RepID=A0AAD3S2M5_NEPGR|nr:hypothetical protein Nepgr_004863 [Nepenthes gracilis]